MAGSPVSSGTGAGAHARTHRRMSAPAARAVRFPANPARAASMPCQCRRRARAARRESAVPTPREHRNMPNPRTRGGIPANDAATQAAPHRRQPPVFPRNQRSVILPAGTDDHACSRPVSEHPIHAVSRHPRRRRGALRGSTAAPRRTPKISNLQTKTGVPGKQSDAPGLASSPKSPYDAATCEESSALAPGVTYGPKFDLTWHTSPP